jgi:hypothetical protein
MTKQEQIAWAAGIFEGEGCCSWTSKEHNCQEAMVKQNDPWLLNQLAQMFGGRVTPCGGTNNLSTNIGNRWRLYGADARAFLSIIYSLLSPRRKWQVARIGVFDTLQVGGS